MQAPKQIITYFMFFYLSHPQSPSNADRMLIECSSYAQDNDDCLTIVERYPDNPAPFLSKKRPSHLSPFHPSPFHLSPLTFHLSPFTSHLSPLTSHLSPFHLSPLTFHLSPLI